MVDLELSRTSGRAFALELGRDPELRRLPILYTSASAEGLRDLGRRARKLPKPIDWDLLRSVVERHCAG